MLIHVTASNISTKQATCHSDSTCEMKILRNGSTGYFTPSGEISFLYQWNHLMPLLTHRHEMSNFPFQGHFITAARAALLPVLWHRDGNDTVSLNLYFDGSTGGSSKVVDCEVYK